MHDTYYNDDSRLVIYKISSFSINMLILDINNKDDNVHVTCDDHNKRLWKSILNWQCKQFINLVVLSVFVIN